MLRRTKNQTGNNDPFDEITIEGFVRVGCPYSEEAKRLIESYFKNNNKLTIVEIENKDQVKHDNGFSTYPHLWIHVDGEKHFIGGCSVLQQLLSYADTIRELMTSYQATEGEPLNNMVIKKIQKVTKKVVLPYKTVLLFYIALFFNDTKLKEIIQSETESESEPESE
jgi:glutaredoxin